MLPALGARGARGAAGLEAEQAVGFCAERGEQQQTDGGASALLALHPTKDAYLQQR